VVPQTYYGCAHVFFEGRRLVGKRPRNLLCQGANHLGDADGPSLRASNKRCTTRIPAPPVVPAGCSRGVAVEELGMENQGSTERASYGPQVGVRCERVLGRVLTLACNAPLLPRCGCPQPHRCICIFLFSSARGALQHERNCGGGGARPWGRGHGPADVGVFRARGPGARLPSRRGCSHVAAVRRLSTCRTRSWTWTGGRSGRG
jgi:hypothetical protein